MRSKDRAWTNNEKDLLRKLNHLPVSELMSILNRSEGAIYSMRVVLGLSKHRSFRNDQWDDKQDARLTELWLLHKSPEVVASVLYEEFKIVRSVGAIKLRAFQLGLKREARRTKLIQKFGEERVPLDQPVDTVKAALIAEDQAIIDAQVAADAEKVSVALDQMVWNLRNHPACDRRHEFRQAMLAGATLEQVGSRMGITRERVRQIVHVVRPKYEHRKIKPGYRNPAKGKSRPKRMVDHTIVCTSCDCPFTYSGPRHGNLRRFCDLCIEIKKKQNHLIYFKRGVAKVEAKIQQLEEQLAQAKSSHTKPGDGNVPDQGSNTGGTDNTGT